MRNEELTSEETKMKGDELSDRFLEFAARIIRLVLALPKNPVARHIGGQLLRSGTAIGANYEEARGAESRADFIHKLGVAWKESREIWYWLRLIQKTTVVKPSLIDKSLQESNEIAAILGKSLATAKGKKPDQTTTFHPLLLNS
jgi:four helix bundle protein